MGSRSTNASVSVKVKECQDGLLNLQPFALLFEGVLLSRGPFQPTPLHTQQLHAVLSRLAALKTAACSMRWQLSAPVSCMLGSRAFSPMLAASLLLFPQRL